MPSFVSEMGKICSFHCHSPCYVLHVSAIEKRSSGKVHYVTRNAYHERPTLMQTSSFFSNRLSAVPLLGVLLILALFIPFQTAAAQPLPPRQPKQHAPKVSGVPDYMLGSEALETGQIESAKALGIWAGPGHVRLILEADELPVLPKDFVLESSANGLYQVHAPAPKSKPSRNSPASLGFERPIPARRPYSPRDCCPPACFPGTLRVGQAAGSR